MNVHSEIFHDITVAVTKHKPTDENIDHILAALSLSIATIANRRYGSSNGLLIALQYLSEAFKRQEEIEKRGQNTN